MVDGSATLPAGSPNTKPVWALRKKQAKALAEIVLHSDVAQLSFIKDDDPKAVWDGLLRIHQARGMASRLALRCQFLRLQKGDQSMQNFISRTRRLATELQELGVTVDNEDLILVLTGGLPQEYQNFVITLDSTPTSQLNLDYVITRLLNEESRQANSDDPSPTLMAMQTNNSDSKTKRSRCALADITCVKCGKKGHYQSACPQNDTEEAHGAVEFSGLAPFHV